GVAPRRRDRPPPRFGRGRPRLPRDRPCRRVVPPRPRRPAQLAHAHRHRLRRRDVRHHHPPARRPRRRHVVQRPRPKVPIPRRHHAVILIRHQLVPCPRLEQRLHVRHLHRPRRVQLLLPPLQELPRVLVPLQLPRPPPP